MCSARVLEPSYHAIKQRLMDGAWPWGFRLEASKIADMLSTSITPVRDSLHRLVGERMVSFAPGQGFHVPRMNETELRELFELNLILLLAATASSSQGSPVGSTDNACPDQVPKLFLKLASRSENGALVASISALNDRLHQFRRCDPLLFQDLDLELAHLMASAANVGSSLILRRLILRYHNRRRDEAAGFIRLMTSGMAS
ncbi:GntR family transcriptional regulator [Sphingopyxis witflariensis]|uniref:HTH gntR-type domain-containing protein n=1 Tax=Sphingopyxis witflariensis TaxID=173675 RepID=A0A246K5U3_9SPHN|nr:GntR family transcriptional regulator [Sphingopyxis witflariensis]OWR01245.1 hypothetical protein CDQ91_02195 [Sphingopyxis witflariensis]